MAQNEPVWSITEVNAAVREMLENSLMPFWLHGEVGTLNVYSSGHVYLTLKDQNCQLKCTFFRGAEQVRAQTLNRSDCSRRQEQIFSFSFLPLQVF